jgi:hypothetical protein
VVERQPAHEHVVGPRAHRLARLYSFQKHP